MKKIFLLVLGASIIIFAFIIVLFKFGTKGPNIERSDVFSGCTSNTLSGKIEMDEPFAHFEGESIRLPALAYDKSTEETQVLGYAHDERWIEVDLSEQKLIAWEGDRAFLETPVSTGLPWWPTPTGEFRIWIKLRATKMEGGTGKYYYYLPNVPYVMFFENDEIPAWRGFGLHGTYWHDDFGTQRSHGCVNLPTEIAKELYYWTNPVMPEGRYTVWSSEGNQGTKIVIHE
jgi:lipoprotein-anchoring transpeptidase ErfK/SrfK